MLTAEQLFDEEFYLRRNPDVADAVARGIFTNGFEHFIESGQYERRDPSALFSFSFYQSLYPDVADAVLQAGFDSEFDHFIKRGQSENRDPIAAFDTATYLARNPDVAQAVGAGALTPFQHYVQFGQFEIGRSIGNNFNAAYYLQQNLDVAAAVNAGTTTPLEHFLAFGQAEGRRGAPPPAADDLRAAVDLGSLSGTRTVSDSVGKDNLGDIYRFVLNAPANLTLSLNNLVADADIEIIQDFNGNGLIDPASETVAFSVNLGTSPEVLPLPLNAGTYWARVSYPQFVANPANPTSPLPSTTSYNLNLSLA